MFDELGSYSPSFYTAGATFVVGGAIMIFVYRKPSALDTIPDVPEVLYPGPGDRHAPRDSPEKSVLTTSVLDSTTSIPDIVYLKSSLMGVRTDTSEIEQLLHYGKQNNEYMTRE
jgi:hypothetical protein